MNVTKVYIAGPMSGLPSFNYPAFNALAMYLRKQVLEPGVKAFDVVSPAEFPDPHLDAILASPDGDPSTLVGLTGMTWGDYVARAVRTIADGGFNAIVVLPGWEKSRGARLETYIGHLAGLKIVRPEYSQTGWQVSLWEIPRSQLLRAWEGLEEVDRA